MGTSKREKTEDWRHLPVPRSEGTGSTEKAGTEKAGTVGIQGSSILRARVASSQIDHSQLADLTHSKSFMDLDGDTYPHCVLAAVVTSNFWDPPPWPVMTYPSLLFSSPPDLNRSSQTTKSQYQHLQNTQIHLIKTSPKPPLSRCLRLSLCCKRPLRGTAGITLVSLPRSPAASNDQSEPFDEVYPDLVACPEPPCCVLLCLSSRPPEYLSLKTTTTRVALPCWD